jgi:hypothetical protein
MTTIAAASGTEEGVQRLGVLRATVTGAVVAPLFFVLCWIGTFIPFSSPTHAYIGLFTPAPMSSAQALLEGSCWSLVFGAVAGFLLSIVYKALEPLGR